MFEKIAPKKYEKFGQKNSPMRMALSTWSPKRDCGSKMCFFVSRHSRPVSRPPWAYKNNAKFCVFPTPVRELTFRKSRRVFSWTTCGSLFILGWIGKNKPITCWVSPGDGSDPSSRLEPNARSRLPFAVLALAQVCRNVRAGSHSDLRSRRIVETASFG